MKVHVYRMWDSLSALYIGITKLRHSRVPEAKWQLKFALLWKYWIYWSKNIGNKIKTCIGNKLGRFPAILEKYDFDCDT